MNFDGGHAEPRRFPSASSSAGRAGAQVDFPADLPLVVRPDEATEAAGVMSREAWRASDDQEVLDLSQLDYDETGEVYALDPALIESVESVDVGS